MWSAHSLRKFFAVMFCGDISQYRVKPSKIRICRMVFGAAIPHSKADDVNENLDCTLSGEKPTVFSHLRMYPWGLIEYPNLLARHVLFGRCFYLVRASWV